MAAVFSFSSLWANVASPGKPSWATSSETSETAPNPTLRPSLSHHLAYLLTENIWLNSGFTASPSPERQTRRARSLLPASLDLKASYIVDTQKDLLREWPVCPQERLGLKLSFWSSGATGCGQGTRHPRVTDEPAEAAAYQQGDTHGPGWGGLPVLPLSCAAAGGGGRTDRRCPRPDQLLPGVEGDLLPGPGCRDPGPQLCGGSKGVGCGGRAEEGRSIASARRGPGAGMRLPKQELSGEGAGQESRGQRGGRDSSGTRLGRPGFRPDCLHSA